MMNRIIQRFEYEKLLIGEEDFKDEHWKALGLLKKKQKFFDILYNGVQFTQYVGVIQVGNITIEVLPKIGKQDQDKDTWQKVLIDMLQQCRWMKAFDTDKASLKLKYNSILEAYLNIYLIECESLLRQGLVKKYRTIERNCTALKGKLLHPKNISKNVVHKERFYTAHSVYDKENTYNQILLQALRVIPSFTSSPRLIDRVYDLIFSFPEFDNCKINEKSFERLTFDRKTQHYKEAIEIARMLLLNYRPDVSGGKNNVLSIMFAMNDLWEKYIEVQLRRNIDGEWYLGTQREKQFWIPEFASPDKKVKPDLFIRKGNIRLIIDTKWKLPENDVPSDADLKQMFVYNKYWHSHSILLYPRLKYSSEVRFKNGSFVVTNKEQDESVNKSKCGLAFVSVLDENNKLDPKLGTKILDFANNPNFIIKSNQSS